MLLGFFVYEAFKQDVCTATLDEGAYPTTFRRRVLDVAGKLVRGKNRLVLKVTQATWEALDFEVLWKRANAPPALAS